MKAKGYGILSVLFAVTLAAAPAIPQEKGKGKGGHEERQKEVGEFSKHSQEFVAGKAKGKDMVKAVQRRGSKKVVQAEGKKFHGSGLSHGRLAGELPPGLKRFEEKHGGHLPPGLEKQLAETGHLPPGLEKGGRR